MGCGPLPKHTRNWAIWREYCAGGTGKAVGERYGVSAGRVLQIRDKCDKEVKRALERELHVASCPLPDSVREGLLGVEFTFTMDDPWNPYTGRKGWKRLSDGSWFKFNIGGRDE